MRYSILSAAVLAAVTMSAQADTSLGGYNFEYEISGDKTIRPVQVFDNGQATYIQMSARSANPPAVMRWNGDQVSPVPFRYEFPYLVVDGTQAGELVLALDGRTALVSKRASGLTTGVATPVMVGAAASPVVTGVAVPVDAYPVAAAPSAAEPVRQPEVSVPVPLPDYSGELEYQPTSASVNEVTLLDESGGAPAVHKIKRGDTLSALASRYGVSVAQIAADNNISNPNLIYAGQSLTIGSSSSIKMVRTAGESPKIEVACQPKSVKITHASADMVRVDGRLVEAVRVAASQYDKIVIRGHSSADTPWLRAKMANYRAEAMRNELIARGIPASRLVVAKSRGNGSTPPRVDIVMIGGNKNV